MGQLPVAPPNFFLTKFSKLDFEPILKKIINRTIISFVQPQPNAIQNKNNPIGCGTVPGNLVGHYYQFTQSVGDGK